MTKKELKEWYKACDFIKKEMQFYSLPDFYRSAGIIKYYFDNSDSYTRQLYQWYVFSNPNITMEQKENIWDFITDFINFDNENVESTESETLE